MGETNTDRRTVHLQAVGAVPGKPAAALEIGDRVGWNFGYISTVLDIQPCGRLSLRVLFTTAGTPRWRSLRRSRLLAIVTQRPTKGGQK